MSRTDSQPTPRRGFLGTIAAASLAIGMGGTLAERAHAAARDIPQPWPGSPDVERWPEVKGKHRQVYDAVSWNHGMSLIWSMIFLNTNNQASKAADSDLTAVVVLRHEAIPLAFTDPIWEKYKLGEAFKIDDPKTKSPSMRNFFYHSGDGDLMLPGSGIETLQARGVQFGVCSVALAVYSGMRADAIGVDKNVAKQEWTAAVVPGITLLPSGVWGVNRAQEHGCTYCYAS